MDRYPYRWYTILLGATRDEVEWKDSKVRATSTIRMCLADEVMYHVMDEESPTAIWLKLESWYM